ncbi:MAG TPA: hypothetical protein VLH19_04175 [Patescibacteria group bacterium]|nr:hypothetical protein [Patescibacteria group bacterium]
MKTLKKKILLHSYLWQTGGNERGLSFKDLYTLLPDFQPSSIRGETGSLRDQKAVGSFIKNGELYFRLTSFGRDTVVSLFPILFPHKLSFDGTWTVCAFVGQENVDQFFRVTRDVLHSLGFVYIRKGLYMGAGKLMKVTKQRLSETQTLNAVFVCETKKMMIADEHSVGSADHHLKELSLLVDKSESKLAQVVETTKLMHYLSLVDLLIQFPQVIPLLPEKYLPHNIRTTLPIDQVLHGCGEVLAHVLSHN